MFVHAVYFTLRSDLSDAERALFRSWQPRLCAIPSVHAGYIGVPADTDRPVIDRAYTHALVLLFADAAAEQAYQVHPEHDRFKSECAGFWDTVRIFDSVGG
jgi:Stress responsive A/B Barrel Domain